MASPNEVIDALETLAVHCRPPIMSQDERSRWLASWVEDLRQYPAQAVTDACRRWRNGTDRKFPMPGQLKPMVEGAMKPSEPTGTAAPWRPLSEAEYADLTVREKIRHQMILASQCRAKAGPQAKHKFPVPADEMPPEWHELRAEAARHEAEAKRLRSYIAQDRAA